MAGQRHLQSVEALVKRWVRQEVTALRAYHVPDAGGVIKLDAMENPYSWPGELIDGWLDELRHAAVNRYPDPEARRLTAALRDCFALPDQAGVLLGNGSDELIQLVMQAVSGPGRSVLAPEPSFSMYRMIARFVGLEFVGVPLQADNFDLDRDAMLSAIHRHQPAVVFLSYPNNPTGNLFERDVLEEIIEQSPGLVVIDEAYHAFAGASLLDQLGTRRNLLVLRTLSKMGLAGLRLGYLVGDPAWLDEFNKIRLPYNINVLTQLTATFALQHYRAFREQTDSLCREREVLYRSLCDYNVVQVYPSHANFILFRVAAGSSGDVFAGLRDSGVLVKNLHGSSDMLSDCLRVTVGKPDENRAFLAALTRAMAQESA